MIRGLYSGYQGKIYIFYRGPIQVVLSDVHGGFNMGDDLAATSLRIVLRPNKWTECAYSYVQEGFENHKGQLYSLEQSGWVDIYTDPKEVELVKQGKSLDNGTEPVPMPANQTPAQGAQVVSDTPTPKYFNMQMFTSDKKDSAIQGSSLPAQSGTTESVLDSMKKQNELMQQQMQAMTQMTQAFTNMMNKMSERLDKEK